MNLEFAGKIALVTGAASGIGAAVARTLAEEGADVVVSYGHNEAGARATASAITALGRTAWLNQMDMCNPASLQAGIAHVQALVPRLDTMVLCAGKNIIKPWQGATVEEWNEVLGINLTGPFFLIKGLVPLLSQGASIVTVASVAAQTGAPHHLHYAAAKAGVINLTKSFARGLAPKIRVNCVAPGVTITAMGEDTIAVLAPDYAQTKIPVQRYASAEEMARCIVFVASPVAGFMTGATIDINGGREMR